jgi:hypothetical protein
MDFGTYFAELAAAERLRELRAAAARQALLHQATRGRRPGLRARLGQALIRVGQRLAAPVEPRAHRGDLAQARPR